MDTFYAFLLIEICNIFVDTMPHTLASYRGAKYISTLCRFYSLIKLPFYIHTVTKSHCYVRKHRYYHMQNAFE